ncbi:glycerophosphoryl diester phosphodiesterase [Hymenobacter swuensis DY53]|uniref:Glycerophosphoryl diester phosphodiesterase n=1 Tax=Hymenobacter swuensis DY53 TaxID=1227739 RepID=W8F357_9BACT|nr:glycerophosphoryl diester phosphodiesterase [Hymenobacter swuensis DY53]
MPAFRRAVEIGVEVIELDVVISADEQVVVSHEPWMSATICRQPDGRPILPAEQTRHNLYSLSYADIRAYDCGLTQHPGFPSQQPQPAAKPLLREVVSELDKLAWTLGRPAVRYSVEIKSSPAYEPGFQPPPARFLELVLAELQTTGILGRTTLLCFDTRVLRLAYEQLPEMPLCLLVEDTRPLHMHLAELGFQPHIYGPDFRLLTPELAASLRTLGIGLVPWTVNEPADLRRMLQLHPTGITTDYPDRLMALRSAV